MTRYCYGHNPGVHRPAEYLWYAPIGNIVPLCAECCALWRADAQHDEDPTLKPVRITKLEAP